MRKWLTRSHTLVANLRLFQSLVSQDLDRQIALTREAFINLMLVNEVPLAFVELFRDGTGGFSAPTTFDEDGLTPKHYRQ